MMAKDERSETQSTLIISEMIEQYLIGHSRAGAIKLSGISTSKHRLEVEQVRGGSPTSMRANGDFMLALGKTGHTSLQVNLAKTAAILLIKLSQFNDKEITLENEGTLISERYIT